MSHRAKVITHDPTRNDLSLLFVPHRERANVVEVSSIFYLVSQLVQNFVCIWGSMKFDTV